MKFRSFLCAVGVSSALMAGGQPADRHEYWLGADLSGITEWESKGIATYTREGVKTETTELMKQLGIDAVRIRVWVDPKDGLCNGEDVLKMALRAKNLDMAIMIDFHYSDWWADPGKQNMPEKWKTLSFEELNKALYDHTFDVLKLLKDNNIDVKWVQVGNETTNGFLWPVAQLEQGAGENIENYATLTTTGYKAVKAVYPSAISIVHLDNGYDRQLYTNMFDALERLHCPYDMIGLSVYPFWSKRDMTDPTSVTDIVDNINYLYDRYKKDIMIVETGVEVSKPAEGRDFLSRLMEATYTGTDGHCKGIFYWAPETCHGGYQLGAFADDRPTEIMDAFTDFSARLQQPIN